MAKLVALALVLASRIARADDTNAQPPAPQTQEQADDELRRMAQDQITDTVIEIYDERPDKPFDRDTDVRLTGEQLAARGAVDLAQALALLPDVTVRDAGRGGFNIDVRGARKGSVTILIDGVAVTDPFYGTFDVSSIPITDIVQIRVSTSVQSPIDGIGGPGGVIEVHTRDAVGAQQVVARLTGDSLPSFGMTGTARAMLSKHMGLRISASGLAAGRDLVIPGGHTLDEDRHAATGSARLEYRDGDRRVVLDGFLDSRHYLAPANEDIPSDITMIDRETSARVAIKIDDKIDKLSVQAQLWGHELKRLSRHFTDYTLDSEGIREDLRAYRVGGLALVSHPIGKTMRWAASVSIDRDSAYVTDETARTSAGDIAILEAAGDVQYETKNWRLDVSAGAAVPLGGEVDPWPEAKLVARYKATKDLELIATGGRKGRVPTLRELYDLELGNPALAPEKSWQGELRGIEQIGDRLRIEAAPYVRVTDGTIKGGGVLTPDNPQRQVNLDRVTIFGIDAQARVAVHRLVDLGGSFGYIHARSDSDNPQVAMTPLDRLPGYRADGWVQVQPDKHVAILARARYFGTTLESSMPLPAYTLFEATITAPLTNNYLAVLRVDDATNVRPETRAGYHTIGRVVSLVVQGTWD